ncbi:MAG: SsrA-binding protein [Kouleothrix sp.]
MWLYDTHLALRPIGQVQQPRANPPAQAAAPPRDQPHPRQVERQGFTLVPLRMYFKGRRAKIDLGLARGKKLYDKRDDIAKREAKRDIERAMKSRSRE